MIKEGGLAVLETEQDPTIPCFQNSNTPTPTPTTVTDMTALATTSMAIDSEPHLEFNVKEWSYLAEGGFHLILRYDGPDPNLQGKILRIGKKSLGHEAAAPTTVGNEGTVAPAASASTLDEAGARRRFERGVLMPLLGKQYVQPGDAVMITTDDIRSIHERFERFFHVWCYCSVLFSIYITIGPIGPTLMGAVQISCSKLPFFFWPSPSFFA